MRLHQHLAAVGRVAAVATLVGSLGACGGDVVRVEVYSFDIDGQDVTLHVHQREATVADPEDATGRVRAAVQALLDFEPPKGQDNLWHTELCAPSDEVARVSVTARLVTVNLEDGQGGAACDLSEEGAVAQRQQIVWTAHTAARNDAPVLVTFGEDDYRLFDGPLVADPAVLAAD
jgi:hypothetical protein